MLLRNTKITVTDFHGKNNEHCYGVTLEHHFDKYLIFILFTVKHFGAKRINTETAG